MTRSNVSFAILYEQLLTRLGFIYFVDIIFLTSSCISFIDLCLDLVSICILFNKKFKSIKLFDYMKVYVINSTVVCILSLPAFLISRRFAFANEFAYGTIFVCYIYGPLVNTCYVLSALIDVAVLLDRITLFTRKFDFVNRYSLRLVCSTSLICGLLIGGQFYIFYYPETLEVYLSPTLTLKFFYTNATKFADGLFGSILFYIVLFLKDILTTALVTKFNIISIVLFKRYLTQRSKLFNVDNLNNKRNYQK
jgi:hypothetical protein